MLRGMRSLLLVTLLASFGCGGSRAADPATAGAALTPPRASAPGSASVEKDGPPIAVQQPITHTYHGTTVSDPYEWLEGDTAAVHEWSQAENAYARHILD